ncbi:transporter substrate-binding domain-containing protein [Teredinibacter sp. KSP-S5-2]|uniref:transporter substrate-binding domain-containing protein n=1 Tax=Teredinibacter sp. KSP-S5-2 TaxID=3034506 RepID=UPI002934970C|nr:transporter substrate-binding domain-containing protein [Teredinibacter sp. KSP-S5-2]WNO10643.1 transporter substrate-binding domain-containing protein [Teredinibacter sp. KSP-S5-2]
MRKIRLGKLMHRLLFVSSMCGFSINVSADDLVCGIANGFPPYQYQSLGVVSGFDADVLRLVVSRTNKNLKFAPGKWDDVINYLRIGKVDCISGMEINELRKKYFDFTTEYYHRYDVVFVRADDDSIKTIDDLYGKKITGDRHSFVENYWKNKGIKEHIRIKQTGTKEQAMELLYQKDTVAAIMPKAVGLYLAKQLGFSVKVLENPDPGSPVAIAVKKGNASLLQSLDSSLRALIEEGEIERLYLQWF